MPLKTIRHDVYSYIESKGLSLSHDDRAFINARIMEHSKERIENYKRVARQHYNTDEKVNKYLKKANTLPPSPSLKVQVETLELVKDWLHADPEATNQ